MIECGRSRGLSLAWARQSTQQVGKALRCAQENSAIRRAMAWTASPLRLRGGMDEEEQECPAMSGQREVYPREVRPS